MGKFDRFFEDIDEPQSAFRSAGEDTSHSKEIRGLPKGKWIMDGVYLMEFSRRIGSPHGGSPLESPDEMSVMRRFGTAGKTVFLDLETTGLTGGTGIYAFLCGIGRVVGDEFRVMELFLEGPGKEASFLDAIGSAIPPGSCLVTFNGAAFDIPLLQTRHVLARSEPSWSGMPHVDMLHHARRLYRGYLDSCSLSSLERNVLRVNRGSQDIPGSQIPLFYAQYLRSGDASRLRGVFYHNELDIVSLASLYCRIAHVLDGNSANGRELLRAGDIWCSRGDTERAMEFWNTACSYPVSEAEARLRRARVFKSSLDFASAREDLLFALARIESGDAGQSGGATVYGLREELAKLEEHRFGSPDRALEHTKSALLWIKRNRHLLGRAGADMYRSMMHRYVRLTKKIMKARG
ncbi:MAG: ribonuclease H-like domain-containing protein [Synergistaceae bacterium]|jgi:uncharacterized protein YprB with RNaseH-like and TPR domain|nr:ribonuclease H-like domain-containing protein [Synergistaceae bacterium]